MLSSCGGSGGGGSESVANTNSGDTSNDITDLTIAKVAYSSDQRTPEAFYAEPARYSDRSEFRFHVFQRDISTVAVTVDYEVCSDDFAQALSWAQTSTFERGFAAQFSASGETEWYFDFEHVVDGDEPAVVINRVFKCNALDRQGLSDDGYAGRITKTAPAIADLQFVVEYLWQFSVYNNALHAVVGASTDSTNYTLHRAEVQLSAGDNNCDRVELWDWRYSFDPQSGDMQSEQRFVRAFDAIQENAAVRLCAN